MTLVYAAIRLSPRGWGNIGDMSISGDPDCPRDNASTADLDPGGVPFSRLDPALLREERTSIKWTRFPADVLPLFVAEMDFAVAPEIQQMLIERVRASDIGYLDGPGPLAAVFADFAHDRWGWTIDPGHVHIATDVATGVVESLRLSPHADGGGRKAKNGRDEARDGGRLAVCTPVYPGFFEMFEEVPFEVVQIPLSERQGHGQEAGLDLTAIEREFASGQGIDAFVLCNPHNPHGLPFGEDELAGLARLAAEHDVFVVSDEIHAPLTHTDETFTPFAPVAAAAGALSVTTTSASKGWNLAGAKCSVVVAADERANRLLKKLPGEVATRVSILGLHANVAAFRDARDWLDRTLTQVEANEELLADLVATHVPGAVLTRPRAGYLSWLDLREAGLGDNPHARILREARVAFGNGAAFGDGGSGHVRVNLACAPDTLCEAIRRVVQVLPGREGSSKKECRDE